LGYGAYYAESGARTKPIRKAHPALVLLPGSVMFCRHEIDELLERDDLTDADKEAVLG
jgi:hypothetical protein